MGFLNTETTPLLSDMVETESLKPGLAVITILISTKHVCLTITNFLPADGKSEGVGSSEDDMDASGRENEPPEIDPRAEDKELKYQLLKKYSGYLSSLRQEFSKKKKKGKLPKEARQKLLHWWELHYKWPYPSV